MVRAIRKFSPPVLSGIAASPFKVTVIFVFPFLISCVSYHALVGMLLWPETITLVVLQAWKGLKAVLIKTRLIRPHLRVSEICISNKFPILTLLV